ncbi:MAG TPA: DoxX-like family protein [Polyangiaceae bacterium]|nr:DoxX-like family protein [Polyangiaceae bacterium]
MGPAESFWLRAGVAVVWLATGLLVLHPTYRSIGGGYLDQLGLPVWLMPATCLFEVGLGLWVLSRRAGNVITLLQLSMVLTFTVILVVWDARLLVNPFGMLTKNVPILAAVATAWLVEREGWSRRALWLLRSGMAFIWLSEGLLPKVFFQQGEELRIVEGVGLSFGAPGTVLALIGVLQAASGVLALTLSGRWLRVVLAAQIAALVVLPLVVSWHVPWLWFHPFGPFTKNVPIIFGTGVVLWRCSSPS